jgi:hypothetical protein
MTSTRRHFFIHSEYLAPSSKFQAHNQRRKQSNKRFSTIHSDVHLPLASMLLAWNCRGADSALTALPDSVQYKPPGATVIVIKFFWDKKGVKLWLQLGFCPARVGRLKFKGKGLVLPVQV